MSGDGRVSFGRASAAAEHVVAVLGDDGSVGAVGCQEAEDGWQAFVAVRPGHSAPAYLPTDVDGVPVVVLAGAAPVPRAPAREVTFGFFDVGEWDESKGELP